MDLTQEFRPGQPVTVGTSKLVWNVDYATKYAVYLNRQHGRPNARHHLSFKTIRADEVAKLTKVEV